MTAIQVKQWSFSSFATMGLGNNIDGVPMTLTISTLELPQMRSLFNLMRMLVTSTTLNSGTTRLRSKLPLSRRPSKPKMKLKRRPVKFMELPMDLPKRNSCLLRIEKLRSKRLITRLSILRRFMMV